ncbi:MAG TPA: nuclear transport factor 2 family protein [Pyrinomonadaceae bacterium]|jgi:hypothetical protein|nr:nuclear transport factor 2 family protein [Pyrinomonadaceae bacterium]
MRKVCILLFASLALAASALGQSAPTNQPDSPRIKPPTATSTGGSSSSDNPVEAMLIAREKEAWEQIKKKNGQGFSGYLAEDQIYVTKDGVHSKAETVKGVVEAGPTEIAFSDWKVVMIDKDAAIVTYTTKVGAAMACGPEPMTQRESTVWVKRGGKWLAIFHQDTPAGSGGM